MSTQQPHLHIVGGAPDRVPDREILVRAAHLAGGAGARVEIIAVGGKPDADKLHEYVQAYEALGVSGVQGHSLESKADADDPRLGKAIADATCVILAAGDPQALAGILVGSLAERRVHEAFERHGACLVVIGGAASAIARHLVTEGKSDIHPRAGLIALAPGLGFLDRVVIDHHFSEKQRMGRLLSILAQTPDLLGVGVDARTAMLVTPGKRLEVIGQATVTILDGRTMSHTSVGDVSPGTILAMGNVQLHLLPAGFIFDLDSGLPPSRGVVGPKVPTNLREVVAQVVSALPYKGAR
jgi:cyanophycinase